MRKIRRLVPLVISVEPKNARALPPRQGPPSIVNTLPLKKPAGRLTVNGLSTVTSMRIIGLFCPVAVGSITGARAQMSVPVGSYVRLPVIELLPYMSSSRLCGRRGESGFIVP